MNLIALAAGVALFISLKHRTMKDAQARGIRNNNPGNIRRSMSPWRGKVNRSTDVDFEQFDTPHNGIRALAKTLTTYQRRYGLRTIAGMIARWAPASENPHQANYIKEVAKRSGVGKDEEIDLQSNPVKFKAVVKAIIRQENGAQYADHYDDNTVTSAIREATV